MILYQVAYPYQKRILGGHACWAVDVKAEPETPVITYETTRCVPWDKIRKFGRVHDEQISFCRCQHATNTQHRHSNAGVTCRFGLIPSCSI